MDRSMPAAQVRARIADCQNPSTLWQGLRSPPPCLLKQVTGALALRARGQPDLLFQVFPATEQLRILPALDPLELQTS